MSSETCGEEKSTPQMKNSSLPGEGKASFEGTRIGEVKHYYGKISVVVLTTEAELSKGDRIRIYDKKGNVVFEQEVESMQIEGKDVERVEKGTDIGLKVNEKAKEGYIIYKI